MSNIMQAKMHNFLEICNIKKKFDSTALETSDTMMKWKQVVDYLV